MLRQLGLQCTHAPSQEPNTVHARDTKSEAGLAGTQDAAQFANGTNGNTKNLGNYHEKIFIAAFSTNLRVLRVLCSSCPSCFADAPTALPSPQRSARSEHPARPSTPHRRPLDAQPGRAQQRRHILIGKAQHAVRQPLTQFRAPMRRQVHDQQPPARRAARAPLRQ